jgi:hypothetical protein
MPGLAGGLGQLETVTAAIAASSVAVSRSIPVGVMIDGGQTSCRPRHAFFRDLHVLSVDDLWSQQRSADCIGPKAGLFRIARTPIVISVIVS